MHPISRRIVPNKVPKEISGIASDVTAGTPDEAEPAEEAHDATELGTIDLKVGRDVPAKISSSPRLDWTAVHATDRIALDAVEPDLLLAHLRVLTDAVHAFAQNDQAPKSERSIWAARVGRASARASLAGTRYLAPKHAAEIHERLGRAEIALERLANLDHGMNRRQADLIRDTRLQLFDAERAFHSADANSADWVLRARQVVQHRHELSLLMGQPNGLAMGLAGKLLSPAEASLALAVWRQATPIIESAAKAQAESALDQVMQRTTVGARETDLQTTFLRYTQAERFEGRLVAALGRRFGLKIDRIGSWSAGRPTVYSVHQSSLGNLGLLRLDLSAMDSQTFAGGLFVSAPACEGESRLGTVRCDAYREIDGDWYLNLRRLGTVWHELGHYLDFAFGGDQPEECLDHELSSHILQLLGMTPELIDEALVNESGEPFPHAWRQLIGAMYEMENQQRTARLADEGTLAVAWALAPEENPKKIATRVLGQVLTFDLARAATNLGGMPGMYGWDQLMALSLLDDLGLHGSGDPAAFERMARELWASGGTLRERFTRLSPIALDSAADVLERLKTVALRRVSANA